MKCFGCDCCNVLAVATYLASCICTIAESCALARMSPEDPFVSVRTLANPGEAHGSRSVE